MLFLLTWLGSLSVHAVYLAKDDPLAISCTCISNAMNRLEFVQKINDTCPEILVANKCYVDLPRVPFTCSSTSGWFIICKLIAFICSVLDTIIPIIIWGRSFKPNLLSYLAVIIAFVATLLSSQYYVVLTCELVTLLIAWAFVGIFISKAKVDLNNKILKNYREW
jgi:hypothetical protein